MRFSARSSSRCGSALASSTAPSRGGSISTRSSGPSSEMVSAVAANRLAQTKRRRRRQAVELRVRFRPGDERLASLDPDHAGAAARDRQREIAQPAEEVGDALAGLRVEQLQRAAHEHAVDRGVDLREIRRREGHRDVEFGQRVGERRRRRMEGDDGLGSARLQPELDRCASAKATSFARSVVRQGFEDAQDQRIHERRRRSRAGTGARRSPTASSICGSRSRIDSDSTSVRSAGSSAETFAGSTWHSRMSATKLDLRSWKPTSTPPFFATSRTDRRAR